MTPPTNQTLGPRMAMVAAWICSPGSMIEPSAAIILALGLSLSATRPPSRVKVGRNPTTSRPGWRWPGWRWPARRSAGLAFPLPGSEHRSPLQLVQAAPDPMGLPDAEGIVEAFQANRAAHADGSGS